MKSIRVPGSIDENNRLILDESLDVLKPQKVKLDIWLIDEDEDEYYSPTKEEILESISEGFRDCLEGRTSPVEKMWDELMIQTTGAIDDEGRLILDAPLRETKPQDVDVVIWFIRDRKSVSEVSEALAQNDRQTAARELISSER
jgi:hypothetical protein